MDILEELIKVNIYFIGNFKDKLLMMNFNSKGCKFTTMCSSKENFLCIPGENLVSLKSLSDNSIYTIKRCETGFALFDNGDPEVQQHNKKWIENETNRKLTMIKNSSLLCYI